MTLGKSLPFSGGLFFRGGCGKQMIAQVLQPLCLYNLMGTCKYIQELYGRLWVPDLPRAGSGPRGHHFSSRCLTCLTYKMSMSSTVPALPPTGPVRITGDKRAKAPRAPRKAVRMQGTAGLSPAPPPGRVHQCSGDPPPLSTRSRLCPSR